VSFFPASPRGTFTIPLERCIGVVGHAKSVGTDLVTAVFDCTNLHGVFFPGWRGLTVVPQWDDGRRRAIWAGGCLGSISHPRKALPGIIACMKRVISFLAGMVTYTILHRYLFPRTICSTRVTAGEEQGPVGDCVMRVLADFQIRYPVTWPEVLHLTYSVPALAGLAVALILRRALVGSRMANRRTW
jgi:hypothetical protein